MGMSSINPELLKHHPKNVKNHTEEQINGIAEAIKLLGYFKDPLIIDKHKTVWIGNGRLDAALLLKMPLVPYIPLDHLTAKQRKALMILDNRLNESSWNKENTLSILSEIQDFDFEIFNVDLEEFEPEKEITEDDTPEIREKTDVKIGDIYKLGNHMVMCGDCTNTDHVRKLLSDKTVDLLLTDPPYGVDYGNKNKYLNSIAFANRIEIPIINDDIKNYKEFFKSFLKIIPFSIKNIVYLTISGQKLLELSEALLEEKFKISQYLVWKKNSHVLGRQDYSNIHELIIYGWKGSHKNYSKEFRTTILEYDRPQKSDLHPTMKPIKLMSQLITDGSKKGMTVYDPFLGSGSTLIACEQLERQCYGMELDPFYVQVALDRFEKLTNIKPVKLK
jgi:site-specific DNA-methyltransferase (adenine-specific)